MPMIRKQTEKKELILTSNFPLNCLMSLLSLTAKPLKSDVDVHHCFYNPASLCFHIATITVTNYFNASKYSGSPSVI